jgi:hypothetical protein
MNEIGVKILLCLTCQPQPSIRHVEKGYLVMRVSGLPCELQACGSVPLILYLWHG